MYTCTSGRRILIPERLLWPLLIYLLPPPPPPRSPGTPTSCGSCRSEGGWGAASCSRNIKYDIRTCI